MDLIRGYQVIEKNAESGDIALTSNIATGDYANWTAGTYVLGDRAVEGITIYEVVATSTTDQPTVGMVKDVPTWVRVGFINKYRMFELNTGTYTSDATSIEVEIDYGARVTNAVGLFKLQGFDVQVVVTDDVEGVVYDETVEIVDYYVSDWYAYFFDDYEYVEDLVFLDLPAYEGATLSVTVSANGATEARCGVLCAGNLKNIGYAEYGAKIGTIDYSVREVDDFGNYNILERKKVKSVTFPVAVETNRVADVQKLLNSLSTIPTVYIGDDAMEATIVIGYFRTWDINISSPTISEMEIEIEGV